MLNLADDSVQKILRNTWFVLFIFVHLTTISAACIMLSGRVLGIGKDLERKGRGFF